MLPTKSVIIAAIFSQALLHAVTVSTNLQTENQLINMNAYSYMIPVHTNAENRTIGATRMEINHRIPLQSVSANVHAKYVYSDLFSFYGAVGALYPLDDNQLFAQGSLLITPYLAPTLEIGALYETQSGSSIELGASITRMPFDLESQVDGGLFNGYPAQKETNLNANLIGVNFGVTVPLANKFSAFVNMHYGFDLMDTELNITSIEQKNRSVMLDYDNANPAPSLGQMLDQKLRFTCTKVSVGTRFNVTEIDN